MTPGAAGGNVLSSSAAGGAYSRASEAIVRPFRLYHVDRDLSTTLFLSHWRAAPASLLPGRSVWQKRSKALVSFTVLLLTHVSLSAV